MDEFKDVKLIAVHVHGPGLIHSKDPVTKLEDLKGMKVRGGSRVINIMLEQLGATPVGMPVPAVGEALSKGVISATTIPWEVVPAVKVQQIVKNHTAFSGNKGLYTQTFAVAMNKASYDKLPADLKKVIDANSGEVAAALFGRPWPTATRPAWAWRRRAATTSSRSMPPRPTAGSAPPPACAPSGTRKWAARASTARSWLPRPRR
jgi:hypothetical protein